MIQKLPTSAEMAQAGFERRIRETQLGVYLARLQQNVPAEAFATYMPILTAAYTDGFRDGLDYHEKHYA